MGGSCRLGEIVCCYFNIFRYTFFFKALALVGGVLFILFYSLFLFMVLLCIIIFVEVRVSFHILFDYIFITEFTYVFFVVIVLCPTRL